jgi:hypothetical protein
MDAQPEAPPVAGAVFAVGSFTKSTSTGSQVVPHTLGQNPKAVILWTIGKTNETLGGNFLYGFGMSDSSLSGSVGTSTRDAVSTTSSSRRMAAKALTLVQSSGATVAEADLPSWSSTTFTLNWTSNDAQPYVIHYIAIGGPQVTAKLVNWQAPTSAGSKSVVVGFQPEAVIHIHAGAAFTGAPGTSQGNMVVGMGAMDKSGAQWAIQASDVDNTSTTMSSRAQRSNAALYMYTDTGSAGVTKEAKFVSMNADGFTLNFTTANANASQIYSLALAGLKADVGTFNKTTASAPASQAVPSAFKPGAVFMASYQTTAQSSGVISSSTCSFGVGASDGAHEGSAAINAADGVATSSVSGIDKTSKAFIKMNQPPIDAEADMTSFDPTGFTLNWTTSDTTASQICFLALGAP